MAYFERVRVLRDQLLLRGWTKMCLGGSELVVSPDKLHSIVVSSGDENTGSEINDPQTKWPKGVRIQEATFRNSIQFDMLDQLGLEATPIETKTLKEGAAKFAWILLVNSDNKKLKIELSLPVGELVDGRPSSWAERIILPIVPLDDETDSITPSTTPEPGPEFEIEVTRRIA